MKTRSIWTDVASATTVPARDSPIVFAVKASDTDPELYHLLDGEARYKVEAEACYCSVLDECWVTNFKDQPREVKACERVPESQRW